MATPSTRPALDRAETLFESGTAAGLTGAELIERYLTRDPVAAEVAFAAMVDRHGPTVLRVCLDVLGDPHDAADAFQATFLILSRRAGSIRRRESVGSWLHGTALRVARRARVDAARRRRHEARAGLPGDPAIDTDRDDSAAAIHEEVDRLPAPHRSAVVLCYFEGLTHDNAADRLGWPVGTVRSRLAWARDRLRTRLARRGLAPTAPILAIVPGPVPAIATTSLAGTVAAIGAGAITGPALLLSRKVLKTMIFARFAAIAVATTAACLIVAGAGSVAARQEPARRPGPARPAAPPDDGVPSRLDGPASDTLDRPAVPTGSPRVLKARLDSALRIKKLIDAMYRQGEANMNEAENAQAKVDILVAQIEEARDALSDELELRGAQLAIVQAHYEAARENLDSEESRIKDLDPKNQARGYRQNLVHRQAEERVKAAELKEVVVKIAQARRRLQMIEAVLTESRPAIQAAKTPLPGLPAPPPAAPGVPQ